MKFEHFSQPIISHLAWLFRLFQAIGWAVVFVLLGLAAGMLGYHTIGHLSWEDSFLEASMILAGMGAIAPMKTTALKLFAGVYALFSGFVVLSCTAIILTPWLHRVLHYLTVETSEVPEAKQ